MDDLISRQAAIDAIERRLAEPAYQHTGEDWYVGMNSAESELYELPSAQPDIARDIATIIENEKDMRVIKENAEQEIIHCGECEKCQYHFCGYEERRADG